MVDYRLRKRQKLDFDIRMLVKTQKPPTQEGQARM
jgi:hypothetical protein